ncbi:hypothetical protein HAPAU_06290 [Halalkalicoccus paucihalophilus]|uniref:Uncharacterized protein n=1 Tax=Halalkalicoccus paucihalophilus TaxID=1008153 RepID=A0A151AIE5_9EURY|nr:DUF5804 family protein [Halalkalicoccus paucihalophilus]KYH27177.1 hypothetical protein HAPAU_06290 [Halalkalicoccus paucihalophilus]
MTTVCIVGKQGVDVRFELLSRETAREALATHDLSEPWENSVAIETVSLGGAVSLLNDLNWYLVRFAETAFVRDPSISTDEWLSRTLAERVRDNEIGVGATAQSLAVYGVEDGRLVEPMYVTRRDGEIPEYDLRDVEETVVVRVAEGEFGS